MNEHGIIIASCDEERVGTFHATAFYMIKNGVGVSTLDTVTDDLPGVNLLRENLVPVGVIGVSGDPETVMPLAKLIKLSFETLYDYELQRGTIPADGGDAMSQLARLLFFDKPANLVRIRALAAELRIAETVNRYPLLIEYIGSESIEGTYQEFIARYPATEICAQGDLLFKMGNFILLFKQTNQSSVGNYRSEMFHCIDAIDRWFSAAAPGHKTRYICGTVQNSFQNYGKVYENMLWLYRYRQKQDAKVYFLGDFLTEYMMSNLSAEALSPFLDIYVRLIEDHMDPKIFRETVGALVATNMNLGAASELLYLHKNTVAIRVKKIRELLGLNPLTSIRDAIFITALYTYIEIS